MTIVCKITYREIKFFHVIIHLFKSKNKIVGWLFLGVIIKQLVCCDKNNDAVFLFSVILLLYSFRGAT